DREVDPAAAAARLDENLRFFHLAEGHAETLPRLEVFGQRDVAARAGVRPDADELREAGRALDRRLVVLHALVDVVGPFAVDGEGALLGAAGAETVVRVLGDVPLDERAHRPAVDADRRIAPAASRLHLVEVGRHRPELVVRLVRPEVQADARQENAGIVHPRAAP